MASAGAEAVFLDTNVLVHANVAESPLHQLALTAIQKRYDAGVELWVSRQVLRSISPCSAGRKSSVLPSR